LLLLSGVATRQSLHIETNLHSLLVMLTSGRFGHGLIFFARHFKSVIALFWLLELLQVRQNSFAMTSRIDVHIDLSDRA
jgi:hypothetical protein